MLSCFDVPNPVERTDARDKLEWGTIGQAQPCVQNDSFHCALRNATAGLHLVVLGNVVQEVLPFLLSLVGLALSVVGQVLSIALHIVSRHGAG